MQKSKIKSILLFKRYVTKISTLVFIISALTICFWFNSAIAISISDNPMETLVQAAAPNIMFILDDSGSMDWEFMTKNSEGKFEGDIEYLFDNPGDNTYTGSDSNATILSGDNRKKWKSQWYGHNRIFYNPNINYEPWPGKDNASMTTPRSNPHYATPTFNLDNTYTSLIAISGTPIIVDNKTNAGNKYATEGNFFTSGTWPESGHSPEYLNSSLYCDASSGISEAFWTPKLTTSGDYDVYVYWACNSGAYRDQNAVYTVNDSSGTTLYPVDQMGGGAGAWYLLGTHYFDSQNSNWPPPTEIYVDNENSSPRFVTTGTWSQSGASPEYLNSSFYSGTNGSTATWTPNLPETGEYEVWFYWASGSGFSRDTGASYIVHDGSGTDHSFTIDQNLDYGQWNLMGTYDFNVGTSGYVKLTRVSGVGSTSADAVKFVRVAVTPDPQYVKVTRGNTNSSGYATSADAVMLLPPGATYTYVDIKNSHYYLLDDTDNDGEYDATEDVYLVNFNGGVRTVYKFSIDGEYIGNQASIVSELPDSIRPKVTTESGEFVRWVTPTDDLQNFANWYSYYRRRELTSKAAISNIINELEGVSVGFYAINSTSHRQPVLPIKLDTSANLIVDNLDSGFTILGSWSESGSPNEYKDSSVYGNVDGAKATWTPNITNAGSYKVSAWWNCYNDRDRNAKYTIVYDGGTDTLYKNQRDEEGNVCGEWVELGTYDFEAGTTGSVSVEHHSGSDGSSTNADAVMFEDLTGSTVNVDETNTLLSALYTMNSANSTPLRYALLNVGRYFHADDSNDGNLGASPYDTGEKGACQHSFSILMTDGYYNGSSPGVGNQDSGMAAPYGDTYSDTLADVAMKYYKEDLSSSLDDLVPTNSCDKKQSQHMITYSVSFGVTGTLTPLDSDDDGEEDDPCFLNDTTPKPTWPNPTAGDSQKIDDLWHAAVNGHGQFFSAGNPEELVASLEALFENIASRISSGASVSVNGEELGSDTTLYQATFSSDTWTGDIYAYPMDPDSGEILKDESDIKWEASGKSGDPEGLQALNWNTDRKIITFNDESDAGVRFRYASLSSNQKTALDPTWAADSTNAENLVDYLRGKEITGFRPRVRKLGDIVHSAPFLKGGTIYAGANDGMLHAFNKDTGRERFAYIPNLVFNNLAFLADTLYAHRFYVDNTASSQAQGKIGTDVTDILVCGLGKGGKGYFALDITDADSIASDTEESYIAANIPLWEFPDSGTSPSYVADLGYSFSQAHIVKTNYIVDGKPKWVVIFGNGYNSTSGYAKLFILDALTGEPLIPPIDTGVGSDNGLSSPTVIDVNNDFKVDYVYAGDLKGNMWKFDLTNSDPSNWGMAFKSGTTPKPLFQAGATQPITIQPDVMYHPSEHGYLVIFGTGKYLDNEDRVRPVSGFPLQSVYGIWDYGDDADDSEYLGTLNHTSGALSFPEGISLRKQTVVDTRSIDGDYYRTLSDNEVQWRQEDAYGNKIELPADGDGNGQKPNPVLDAGWFFDFPNSGDYEGERVIKDMNIRDGMVFVLSFIPNTSPCSGGGNSFFYIINPETGGRFDTFTMDVNGDGIVDEADLIEIVVGEETIKVSPTGKLNIGMLHAPKFIKIKDDLDKVIMSDSSGDIPTVDVRGETLGMYYWIER